MKMGAGEVSGVGGGFKQARLWNLEATGSNPWFASFLPLLFFLLRNMTLYSTGIYAHEMNICMYTTVIHIVLILLL